MVYFMGPVSIYIVFWLILFNKCLILPCVWIDHINWNQLKDTFDIVLDGLTWFLLTNIWYYAAFSTQAETPWCLQYNTGRATTSWVGLMGGDSSRLRDGPIEFREITPSLGVKGQWTNSSAETAGAGSSVVYIAPGSSYSPLTLTSTP